MKFYKPFVGCATIVLTTIATPALAQKVGTIYAEKHPPLPSKICRKVPDTQGVPTQTAPVDPAAQTAPVDPATQTTTTIDPAAKTTQNNDAGDDYPVGAASANCVTEQTSVVLDASMRIIDAVGTKNRCFDDGKWNTSICSTPTECGKVCGLEGDSYENVKTEGGEITLKMVTPKKSSRVHMLDASGTKYQQFYLLNQEITFEADVSGLPCGSNGALYFVKMDADGGTSRYPSNTAGAKYGTGYCDASCPKYSKFIDGEANMDKTKGSCCSGMDIWQSNTMATTFGTHACSVKVQTTCTSDNDCGSTDATKYSGWCDKDGCSYNPFRMGNTDFFGPGKEFKIDTTRPFTVVTQFVTHNNTPTGELVEIRRLYKQDERIVKNPDSTWQGLNGTSSITDAMCSATKTAFKKHPYKMGNLAELGRQMIGGMTMTMSLWMDQGGNMSWLDSYDKKEDDPKVIGNVAGRCPNPGGDPASVFAKTNQISVKFKDIRIGEFGTTY